VLGLGPLPFPHNLWFEAENVADAAAGAGDHSFDLVSAFSVTKWIHLNHGDAGLRAFFANVFESLRPGGRFVYEPQPWKSYRKRKDASPATAKHFSEILVKPPAFPALLEELGFETVVLLGTPDDEAVPKGFRRPIYLAVKPSIASGNADAADPGATTVS